MFKLFRFRKKTPAENPLQDKAAGWLVAKVLWLQTKWVQYLDGRVNKLSIRSKKFGLMVFVGLSLLVCTSILVETFTGHRNPTTLNIGKMRKPVIQRDEARPFISSSQFKRVSEFHRHMDSLVSSIPGKKIYDSIMQCRPGLLDSAKQLEELYQHQNK